MTVSQQLGISVASAHPADTAAIVEAYRASRTAAFHGLVTPGRVTPRTYQEDVDRWSALIAESEASDIPLVHVVTVDDKAVGVGLIEFGEAEPEVGALYVAPPAWRRGAGTLLLEACLTACSQRGDVEAIAWVLGKNLATKAFMLDRGGWLDGAVQVRGEGEAREVLQRVRFRTLTGKI